MLLQRISLLLLLCSAAQAQDAAQQHRREFSRTADSLHGPVSAVEIFRREYGAYRRGGGTR